jgi:polyhydroxyalkanoate synthesis regulator phasin
LGGVRENLPCFTGVSRHRDDDTEVRWIKTTLERRKTVDIVKKAMLLGLGVISLTKEKAEVVVDELIKRGEVSREERFKMVDKLLKEAEKQEEELTGKISETVQKAITKIGLATKKDLEDISKRLEEIEKKIS